MNPAAVPPQPPSTEETAASDPWVLSEFARTSTARSNVSASHIALLENHIHETERRLAILERENTSLRARLADARMIGDSNVVEQGTQTDPPTVCTLDAVLLERLRDESSQAILPEVLLENRQASQINNTKSPNERSGRVTPAESLPFEAPITNESLREQSIFRGSEYIRNILRITH